MIGLMDNMIYDDYIIILFLLLIISTVYYINAGILNIRQYIDAQTLGSVPTFTRLHLKCRSVGRSVRPW